MTVVRWFLVVLIAAFAVMALLTTPLGSDTVWTFVWIAAVALALIGLVLTVGRSSEP